MTSRAHGFSYGQAKQLVHAQNTLYSTLTLTSTLFTLPTIQTSLAASESNFPPNSELQNFKFKLIPRDEGAHCDFRFFGDLSPHPPLLQHQHAFHQGQRPYLYPSLRRIS